MKYKVRITKAPADNMAYGGQSGYGLDLGQRNVYDAMNESNYDSVSDTAQAVSRSAANIEAERGETMVGDLDDDGRLEHQKIGGKPHSEGGTPLNVKPGTFVFSQTKKMAFGGPALQAFGKSGKKKYTPAQLAKQYDLNSYKAIMEDPENQNDPIAQRTAQMMYENNAKKLGMLALIQEGMKGFPQGIPEIARSIMPMMDDEQGMTDAKYGGYYMNGGELPTYQGVIGGSQVPKKTQVVKKSEIGRYEADGFKKVGANLWTRNGQTIEVADPNVSKGSTVTKTIPGTAPQKDVYNGPKMSNSDWLKFLQTSQGQKYKQKYITGTPATTSNVVNSDVTNCPTGYTLNPTTGKCEKINPYMDELMTEEDLGPVPGKVNPYTSSGNSDYGNMPFFGNSLFVGPQREKFYAAPIGAVLPEPTFYDPNRELAANAEQANITQQYLASMGSPQSFMGNAAATQGKAFENAANINSRFQNQNVQVANQFAPAQASIINETGLRMADRADKMFYNNEQGNKGYRNNLRQWLNNVDRYRQNDYQVNSGTNLLNQTNPYYDMVYGRKGSNIRFKPGVNVNDLITNGSSGSAGAGITPARIKEFEAAVADYSSKKYPNAEITRLLTLQFPELYAGNRGSGKNASDPTQNYLDMMLSKMGIPDTRLNQ